MAEPTSQPVATTARIIPFPTDRWKAGPVPPVSPLSAEQMVIYHTRMVLAIRAYFRHVYGEAVERELNPPPGRDLDAHYKYLSQHGSEPIRRLLFAQAILFPHDANIPLVNTLFSESKS